MSEITVWIKSEYGDLLSVLTNGTERGAILGMTYESDRKGGPTSATFYLKEGVNIPLYTGLNVLLQEDGEWVALFDIDGNPDTRGVEGKVEVRCVGLGERLKKVYLTKTITNTGLKTACLDIADRAAAVNIVVATEDIALPDDVEISLLELDSDTLYDFLDTLITYANGAAGVDKYAWLIDTNKHLVVYDASALPYRTLYEGYDFQSPEREVSHRDQINIIHLWRATADGEATEYVDTFTDSSSVDRYGVYEKKIELDYYASNDDCASLAAGIFTRFAEPSRSISVSSVPEKIGQGLYRLFMKPLLVWGRLYAGENKNALDLSNSIGTTYVDDTTSLVGLYSTKCILDENASGYLRLPVDPPVLLPKKVRFFVKGTPGSIVRIELVDNDGDTAETVITLNGDWMQLTLVFDDTIRRRYAVYMRSAVRRHNISEEEAPSVFAGAELTSEESNEDLFAIGEEAGILDNGLTGEFDYALAMKDDTATERTIYMTERGSISSLAEIRFYWETPSSEFWLDYTDCQAKQWQLEEIYANHITYTLMNDAFIASAEFGDDSRTATNELTDLWAVVRSKK